MLTPRRPVFPDPPRMNIPLDRHRAMDDELHRQDFARHHAAHH